MITWWSNLSFIAQVFATIAIPATAIMLFQTVLLLFGFGMDSEADADCGHEGHMDFHDHDAAGDADGGFSLISIRGLVAFFSIGGWVGVVCENMGLHVTVTCIISFSAGFLALLGIAFLFKYAMKLQGSGNINVENAVGKTGQVYIPIPPKGMGRGKINVVIQERLVELEAINEDDTALKTDQLVKVVSYPGNDIVSVTSLELAENKTKSEGGISKWNQA